MSTQAIQNLQTFDPFADAEDAADGQKEFSGKQESKYIHIRIQQRNGRKTLTTIQGIPLKFEYKTVLKFMKKNFSCNGTIVDDKEGEVIQLQGDQRKNALEFMIDKTAGLGLDAKLIKVHGF